MQELFTRNEEDLFRVQALIYKYLYEATDEINDKLEVIAKYLEMFPKDAAMLLLQGSFNSQGIPLSLDMLIEKQLITVSYQVILENDTYVPNKADALSLVEDFFRIRRALGFKARINSIQASYDKQTEESIVQFLERWTGIFRSGVGSRKNKTLKEIYMERIDTSNLIYWHVKQLDELTNGISRGRVAFVAGAPGHGKSTFMANLAYRNVVERKANVVYITLEQSKEDFKLWLACRHSTHPKWKEKGFHEISRIRTENCDLSSEEIDYLTEEIGPDLFEETGLEHLKCTDYGRFSILDTSDFDSMNIGAIKNRIFREDPDVDLVIIDYIQIFKNYPVETFTGYEAVNHYIQQIRTQIAEDFYGRKVAVVMGSQINREGQKKAGLSTEREGIYDYTCFSEANEIEKAAWYAIALYTTDTMLEVNELQIQVLKNRAGRPGQSTPFITHINPAFLRVGDDESISSLIRHPSDGRNENLGSLDAQDLIKRYYVDNGGKFI